MANSLPDLDVNTPSLIVRYTFSVELLFFDVIVGPTKEAPVIVPVAVMFCANKSFTSICAALIEFVVIFPPSMVVVFGV